MTQEISSSESSDHWLLNFGGTDLEEFVGLSFSLQTFAISVSVRAVFLSAWLSRKKKSFGARMAGAKNRRNRKPLIARYPVFCDRVK